MRQQAENQRRITIGEAKRHMGFDDMEEQEALRQAADEIEDFHEWTELGKIEEEQY